MTTTGTSGETVANNDFSDSMIGENRSRGDTTTVVRANVVIRIYSLNLIDLVR
jgi:hypothetical protein